MIDALRADGALTEALHSLRDGDDLDEALARVAWSVIAEPGDGDAGSLLAEHGAVQALRALTGDGALLARRDDRRLSDAVARWTPRVDPRSVVNAVHSARHVGARLVLPGDRLWPGALDDLGPHAPTALWVRGDPALLSVQPRVAMVGARASSAYGDAIAAEFAGELATDGAVIVSGGAYGIDGAAHRAALAVGGATIAFLAGGVDRAYPQGHRRLLQTIIEHGAAVSEVPCGTAPTKWRFLARNRLIAALSDATVVIEAGWRSGSLNTAGHAASIGRPLGAVPGPVTSPASAGCHRLLREYDARCVTSADEIRELWGGATASHDRSRVDDPDRRRLLDALTTRSWTPVTEAARRSGLAPQTVVSLLGLLELEGLVVRGDTGWRRRSDDTR